MSLDELIKVLQENKIKLKIFGRDGKELDLEKINLSELEIKDKEIWVKIL